MTEEEKQAIEYLENSLKSTITHKKQLNIIKNLIRKQQLKLEKKDKIIDKMTLQLVGLTIWDNKKEDIVILKTEEQVKQYFKKESGGKQC